MTLSELAFVGFTFGANHYDYSVRYYSGKGPGITISSVSYRLPHSKAELLEKARRDALRYFMACRLEGSI